MQLIQILNTNLKTSRFIFGTASLFNVGARKERLNLLSAAVDHGFTHFDLAPYYGFGMSERDMSFILKKHPFISVTTKVGIYSPGGENQSAASIFLRKLAGRVYSPISRPSINFSIAQAQISLEGSLRRLGRDHIELYMLHEPTWDLLNSEEWLKWLETKVQAGLVGNFGLALTADKLEPFLEKKSKLTNVVQVLDSLDRKEADILPSYAKPLQITYGYLSAMYDRGPKISVEDALKAALGRNKDGAIIVSTKKIKRLEQYTKILKQIS